MKMKKWLSLVAAVLLIGSTLAWAIEPITVENPSFELPGLEKYKCWDGEDAGAVDVPGWSSDGNPVDSGVETGWGATDGIWTAFLMSGDPSVWQVTEHVIGANEILRLQVDAKNNWAATTLQMSLFAYDETVDPNDPNVVIPVRTPIAAQDVALTDAMQTFTMELATADVPAAAGLRLGIELSNVSAGASWIGLDNVRLASIIPTGVNIVVVTNTRDNDGDGVQDDQNLLDWLVNEGHTVDFRPSFWTNFDPVDPADPNEVPKIDQLNAADLVIISRTANTGDYDDGDEPTMWNSVTVPMLNLHVWMARSNRWKWMNSTAATKTPGPTLLQAVDPEHPIFEGVTFLRVNVPGTDGPVSVVDILDPDVGVNQNSFMGTLDAGNGKLIAQTYGSDMTWIAEWASSVEFYDGAGQTAADHRLLLSVGAQEISGSIQGALNLNSTGLQILRNAINYLLAQPLPVREPSPASGSTGVAVDRLLTWRAGKLATMYNVYFSTSKSAVENGTALIDVVGGTSYNVGPLNLILGTTYYWRVDATDGEQTWPGTVQSFTTTDYLVVDDFESYSSDNIGNTWKDGFNRNNPVQVYGADPAISTEVVHSGAQSMALPFDNSNNPFFIDAYLSWSPPANWTKAGATRLVLYFYGDPGNHPSEKLWMRINGRELVYNGDGLQKAEWTQWTVNLASLDTPQWKIAKIDIGVGTPQAPSGLPGILYVDDIRLYRVAP